MDVKKLFEYRRLMEYTMASNNHFIDDPIQLVPGFDTHVQHGLLLAAF